MYKLHCGIPQNATSSGRVYPAVESIDVCDRNDNDGEEYKCISEDIYSISLGAVR